MNDIIIIGSGGHAKVVISILKKLNKYNIIGYTSLKNKGEVLGVKFLGTDQDIIKNKIYSNFNVAIGIGQMENIKKRKKIISLYLEKKFKFPSIISPNSIINEKVKINDGVVIMDGVVINSMSNIGQFSIINTGATIDHDCMINSYVHICPGVTLSGSVNLGKNIFIGAGSTIINNINVQDNVIVGSGSVVTKDLNKSGTYVGIPARLLK